MKFISSIDPSVVADFREATERGLASDGGLFLPAYIPQLSQKLISDIGELSVLELAYQILSIYTGSDLTSDQLRNVIGQTFTFPMPVKKIGDSGVSVLELFHGPTRAFKDIGARFLAGCLSLWQEAQETTVLVATSGDTGGAVAHGFIHTPGIRVVILYPMDKITPAQKEQIERPESHILAVGVKGDFDDCQRLVRNAFQNNAIRSGIRITSANSINIARWLPQMIFYAAALSQWDTGEGGQTLVVPSGNYGNITSALLLRAMGLGFEKILASHNANDTVPRYLLKGVYQPNTSIRTHANAMDVSDPANFIRFQYIRLSDSSWPGNHFGAHSVSDTQILQTIRDVWEKHGYLLDPHTATAWRVLQDQAGSGLIVATAHPFKFSEVIIQALGYYPPAWNKEIEPGSGHSIYIPVSDAALQEILLGNGG